MWHNLSGQELAVSVPEHRLFVSEFALQHRFSSADRAIDHAQYGEPAVVQQ
jgi:hypothetical protein